MAKFCWLGTRRKREAWLTAAVFGGHLKTAWSTKGNFCWPQLAAMCSLSMASSTWAWLMQLPDSRCRHIGAGFPCLSLPTLCNGNPYTRYCITNNITTTYMVQSCDEKKSICHFQLTSTVKFLDHLPQILILILPNCLNFQMMWRHLQFIPENLYF